MRSFLLRPRQVDLPETRRGPSQLAIQVMRKRFYLRDTPKTIDECTILRGSSEVGALSAVPQWAMVCVCLYAQMPADGEAP